MKIRQQNHLKRFLIMEYDNRFGFDREIYTNERIRVEKINEDILQNLPKQSFCNLEKRLRMGAGVMGIYAIDGPIMGFGCVQRKGQRGDYFYIRNCDVYISDLFIYPEYRGNGIMGEFLRYIISEKGTYRLCVRSNNGAAIRCYKKMGFYQIDKKVLLRIYKDISFPVYRI